MVYHYASLSNVLNTTSVVIELTLLPTLKDKIDLKHSDFSTVIKYEKVCLLIAS